ncbi:putative methyltransferase domain-containing protein [Diplodia seriata]|uniref:Putative methyltransferase domain-containing protein n=1 Tax=Diplodia seriata TaxID=420778 RepID=A0A0G2G7Z7_9PEZI|nr:putative methyltransferase domain-containing protein [Diplodia seriata]
MSASPTRSSSPPAGSHSAHSAHETIPEPALPPSSSLPEPLQHHLAGAALAQPAGLQLPSYAYQLDVDSASGSSNDHVRSDADSALGESDADSTTTSLNSEVVNYRYEHGRRYHAFKEGAYWLPNDEDEADRLDLQHHVWRLSLDGALHAAPVPPNVQDVLDVGTGSGVWAIEFADEYPSAQVIGTDLSAIQPEWVPPNVTFLVDDAESDWDFDGRKFDFIHARMLCLGMHNWQRFIEQCYRHLKPGGWLELQEGQLPTRCDDDSVTKDDPLQKWAILVHEAAAKCGIDTMASDKFSQQLRDQGFETITEQVVKWAVGAWPKGQKQKMLGRWTLENLGRGLQGISVALLTKVLGWSREEVDLFLIDVRQNMGDRKRHFYWQMTVHYAQKPHGDDS